MHDFHPEQQLYSDQVGPFQRPDNVPLTLSHSKWMCVPFPVVLRDWTGKVRNPLQISFSVLLGILNPTNVPTACNVMNGFNTQSRKSPRSNPVLFLFVWSSPPTRVCRRRSLTNRTPLAHPRVFPPQPTQGAPCNRRNNFPVPQHFIFPDFRHRGDRFLWD